MITENSMIKMRSESGFSLAELLIATGLLLVVSSIVTGALMQMTQAQSTIWNRTEMHSGIRGATELLQQEVGQAGRIALPTAATLTAGAAAGGCPTTVTVSPSTSGMFVGELLTVLDGDAQETVTVTAVPSTTTITTCFVNTHLAAAPLSPLGGFATGIVAPTSVSLLANGSTGTVLKMFGDINGDGNMVYVEYKCDTAARNLYRNVMAYNAAIKPAVTNSEILLGNITINPGSPTPPCFTYQTATVTVGGTLYAFVLDVAITLTVETEQLDSVTRQKQTETKALLNVSPRNIFNAWAFAGMGYSSRIQPTPASVTALLP
jgi:type II secretory pathway pseudopilin PulG